MRSRRSMLVGMVLLISLHSNPLRVFAASSGVHSGTQGAMHFIESDGKQPAVVFIHGLTQSSVYWEEWVGALGKCGVRAIAVDLPGFGGSSNAPGPYTLPGLADAVASFIQKRNLGAVTLVGGSMGSAVAQFVALNHPALVQRLVLTAASAQSGSGAPPNASAAAAPNGPRGALAPAPSGARGTFTPEQAREMQKKRWQSNPPSATVDGFFYAKKPPADYAERFYASFQQMNLDAAAEVSAANGNWNTYERLGEIKVPTLIIQGARDPSKTPEEGARMAARMPDARVVTLPNAAHTPQWDERPAFDAAAIPFIMEGEPRGLRCDAPVAPRG